LSAQRIIRYFLTLSNPSNVIHSNRQRPGGSADDADLGKKGGGMFSGFSFGKKKAPEPEPEPEQKKNWWTF
jgi:hypothetical protein